MRIGTSGFSYEDWRESVYPRSLPKSQWFDYYTTLFDCLEINYTYYQMPSRKTLHSLCQRAPEGFFFAVKAHQDMTHKKCLSDAAHFLKAVSIIKEMGFDLIILMQFPHSFRRTSENRLYLDQLLSTITMPSAVEFRHDSWDQPQVVESFKERDIQWVSVDQPSIRGLMPAKLVDTSGVYLRMHGRNAAKWYHHDHAYERYDYQYSEDELKEWVEKIRLVETGRRLVFFNNHFRGKAVINATMMKKMIDNAEKTEEASKKGGD